MKVLAISGWKGSGKDTLALHLVDNFGAVRVSFADPLKDLVASEYDIDRTSLDDPNRKEKPLLHLPVNPQDGFSNNLTQFMFREFRNERGIQPEKAEVKSDGLYGFTDDGYGWCQLYWTPRALAILKGSSNRAVASNFWVQQAIKKANQAEKEGARIVVISDLRYQSEMKQLRQAFGDRLGTVRVERFDSSPSSDPSERDLDNATFDHTINNRGSKEQSFEQIERVLLG